MAVSAGEERIQGLPGWYLWVGGVIVTLNGLAQDLAPRAAPAINLGVIGALLLFVLAIRFRTVGAALGCRASVVGRPPASVSMVRTGGIVAVIAVEFALQRVAERVHSPWNHTIAGVVVGLLLAFGLPWVTEQAYRQHEQEGRDAG